MRQVHKRGLMIAEIHKIAKDGSRHLKKIGIINDHLKNRA
ncbi:hypothetical protein NBRC111894_1007 [Sporolactobacillus inulinus]|uniref:Uncharacterized protein n=1 Tax=Sporolactobacillus inulinus TaxID=2078 RepID=A0A4Y1Z918_9BACL|nr:hypothetical protein NBRC111894_1007 [Sporolactobacillus inulinus]